MAANGTHLAPQLSAAVITPPAGTRLNDVDHLKPVGRCRRFVAAIPLRTALLATAAVWVMGCVWSFREQTLFAQAKGFHLPWLLPAVIDGLAIALACVAYAASLDGRPGVVARLGTAVAVAASAASNATFAWQRSGDVTAVVIAAGVPVAANLAFEVLLHELRRQVMRRRGLPAPAAVPYPRLIRVILAPWTTLRDWRRSVLDLTAIPPAFDTASRVAAPDAPTPAAGDTEAVSTPIAGASAHPLHDALAPLVGSDAPAPTSAALAAASAPAAAPIATRPASTDASSQQFATPRARQLIGSDARQRGGADTTRERTAGGVTDARPDPDAAPRVRNADASSMAEEARQLYRASVAAGEPLTGRQLGRRYDRSPSWGRARISEAKSNGQTPGRAKGRVEAFGDPSGVHHPTIRSDAAVRTDGHTIPVAA
jgi:hypothetical protein